ncbi:MAG: ribonuclease H-like domain-containing protein [Candidatus Goldiibacteriota bacterium]
MKFDSLSRFQNRKTEKKQAGKTAALPGDIIFKNGSEFLLTRTESDALIKLPQLRYFEQEYASCLELIFGIRESKTLRLKECGICSLHDALSDKILKKQAAELLSHLQNGFDAVEKGLSGRFSRSSRLFFLLSAYFKPEDIIFFDLETKGLHCETSIIQAGIGFFKNSIFTVNQFTILSDSAEPEMLEYLIPFFKDKKAIITFNGRTFDVPFLSARCAYYGIAPEFDPGILYNLDLYHFAKKAFKGTQDSFRLKDVESGILKLPRENDIDGAMAPEYYDNFISSGDPKWLIPIIEHNKTDIISLLILFNRIYDEWIK